MQAITQNGVTYFPGANGTWLGTDGKKYVSRGPKTNRQFMEISSGAAYVAPDAGDGNDGGGGFSTRGADPAPMDGQIPATGTDLSPKPVNIPGFVRNPFQSLGGFQDNDGYSVEDAAIFGKTEEERASIREEGANIGRGGDVVTTFEQGKDPVTEIVAPTAESGETDAPEKINWMQDQRSDNAMARRAAVLDYNGPLTPMAMRKARGAAMGMVDELDDTGRMTGNYLLKTADDDTEGTLITGDQGNDYINRGEDFLKDVMSGKIKLGSIPEPEAQYPVQDVDTSDVSTTIPVDMGQMAIGDLRIPDDQMPMGPLGDVFPQLKGLGAETAYDAGSGTWRITSTTDDQGNVVTY